MGFDDASALLAPGPVQRHGGGENTDQVHQAAAHGIAGGGGAMPHSDKIQQAFGSHDISGIQAHTGSEAKQANQAMGAEAYATGNHVGFGSAPDVHTAAHEAAHVVQQGHGVSLGGGVGQVGDSYEQHADKVADAVVSGQSAEPILNEMTGGAAKGGTQQKATQQEAIQQRAVQFETGTGGAGGGGGPLVDPAEAEWQTYLNNLPGDVKTAATTLTVAQRTDFKALNPVQQGTYAKISTPAVRTNFLTTPDVRGALVVISATGAHLAAYESLATDGQREGFRAITPDERTDLLQVAQVAYRMQLLVDGAALLQWRTWRNVAVMRGQPDVCAALGVNPGDPVTFAEEIQKLSIGQAGERLRRLAVEEGFEVPSTKTESLAAIQAKVRDEGKDPWAAMEDLRPNYAFKGKLTKSDGQFGTLPILKAVAYTEMMSRTPIMEAKWKQVLEKNLSDAECPKDPADPTKPDSRATVSGDARVRMFKNYMSTGGTFDPMVDMPAVPIRSGVPAAYWMYDTQGIEAALKEVETTGAEVIKLCAIEESPAYQDGFIIVKLNLVPTVHDIIRRPTMWDGLYFDQFKGVDDPGQSYGITSGGQGEVMVGTTSLQSCQVVRNVQRL